MVVTIGRGRTGRSHALAARVVAAAGVVAAAAALALLAAPAAATGSTGSEVPASEVATVETTTSESGTTEAPIPRLELSPGSGPLGSSVQALLTGFSACSREWGEDVGGGSVVLDWDGVDRLAQTTVSSDGTATSGFLVPEAAALEQHEVTAQCVERDEVRTSTPYTVTPPTTVPVVVPEVVGLSREEAEAALAEEGLEPGEVSGAGPQVTEQDPAAGRDVPRGSAVDLVLAVPTEVLVDVPDVVGLSVEDARVRLRDAGLTLRGLSGEGEVVQRQSPRAGVRVPRLSPVDLTLGAVTQPTVIVPDLVGQPRDEAPSLLAPAGLVLGQVAGDGDVVRSQNPPSGTRVPSGSSVNVSVAAAVPPAELVAVPDLVGATARDARTSLETNGLELGNDPAGDTVTGQDPAAGTLVPLGTSVTLVSASTAPGGSDRGWASVALLAVVAAFGTAVSRSVRGRQGERWVGEHIRVTPRTERPARLDVETPRAGREAQTHCVRVSARSGERICVVEEVGR